MSYFPIDKVPFAEKWWEENDRSEKNLHFGTPLCTKVKKLKVTSRSASDNDLPKNHMRIDYDGDLIC